MPARPRGGRGYRYGRWHGGPDPLAPPYDLGNAVDEIGDSVLAGSGVREALRELLRRGMNGRRGLDDLRRQVRDRLRQARTAGRMDGTLQEVRELLDRAVEAERRELFPDPDDSARLAEAELDALPDDTAGAVRALKDYPWRSDEARQAYQQIQAMAAGTPEAVTERLAQYVAAGARHLVIRIATPDIPTQTAQLDRLVSLRPTLESVLTRRPSAV